MFQLRYAYSTLLQDDAAQPCDREAKIWAWVTGIATSTMAVAVVLGVMFTG